MGYRLRKLTLLAALLSTVMVGAVVAAQVGNESDHDPGPDTTLALVRPEVRGAACPSVAAMQSVAPSQRVMKAGPVTMLFARDFLDHEDRVFAGVFSDGLRQKIPLQIDMPVGTQFRVHGYELVTRAEMTWEGPSSLAGPPRPRAEWTFAPGGMTFPQAGCYQIFVGIEGIEYGPFGFEVLGSNR
jgi:hypothetical protein